MCDKTRHLKMSKGSIHLKSIIDRLIYNYSNHPDFMSCHFCFQTSHNYWIFIIECLHTLYLRLGTQIPIHPSRQSGLDPWLVQMFGPDYMVIWGVYRSTFRPQCLKICLGHPDKYVSYLGCKSGSVQWSLHELFHNSWGGRHPDGAGEQWWTLWSLRLTLASILLLTDTYTDMLNASPQPLSHPDKFLLFLFFSLKSAINT